MNRILYMCFGNPFTEEMSYKENYLIRASLEKDRDVLVIAPTEKYEKNRIINISESDIQITKKLRIVRLNYERIITSFLSNKIRKTNRFLELVKEFKPDVIFFNTIQVYNILDLPQIKKELPEVKVYADVSTSFCNSAQNFLSKYLLHKVIYKSWIHRTLPYFDKIFYVAEASKTFLKEIYGINNEKLEFSPLCSQVYSRKEKEEKKRYFYCKNCLMDNTVVFSHSGKMNQKKKTLELLRLFKETKHENWRLFIAGSFDESIKNEAKKLILDDKRISYLGFLNADGLTNLLCATDLYLQPLSPSQTAQTAMGCLTPVLLANIPEYIGFEESGSFYINNTSEINRVFDAIASNNIKLDILSKKVERFAHKYLDYIQTEERLFK